MPKPNHLVTVSFYLSAFDKEDACALVDQELIKANLPYRYEIENVEEE